MDEEKQKLEAMWEELENLNPNESLYFPMSENIVKKITDKYSNLKEARYEYIAFAHFPDGAKGILDWPTYYGPFFCFPNDDNTSRVPFRQDEVTEEVIKYWEKRYANSKNPFLYTYYAGLLYDYSSSGLFSKPKEEYKYVEKYLSGLIEAFISILNEQYDKTFSGDIFREIERAKKLALKFKFIKKIDELFEVCFKLEKVVGEDAFPGLWGYAAKFLFLNKAIVDSLNLKTKEEVVKDLETRLSRIDVKVSYNAAEHVCSLLIKYYYKSNKEIEIKRVFDKFENFIEEVIKLDGDNNFAKLHYAQSKIEFIEKLDLPNSKYLNSAKEDIIQIRNIIKIEDEELISFEHDISIDQKKIINSMLGSGKIEEAVFNIVGQFVYLRDDAEKDKKTSELSSSGLSSLLLNKVNLERDGSFSHNINALDYEGSLLDSSKFHYELRVFFLLPVISKFIEMFDEEELRSFFLKSSLINETTEQELLFKAFSYLKDKDYLAFSHVAIPMCENIIRLIAKNSGIYIYTANSQNSNFKTLSPILNEVEKTSDENRNAVFFLKFCLTSQQGYNFRNRFAHGIYQKEFMSKKPSFIILVILLSFALTGSEELNKAIKIKSEDLNIN